MKKNNTVVSLYGDDLQNNYLSLLVIGVFLVNLLLCYHMNPQMLNFTNY